MKNTLKLSSLILLCICCHAGTKPTDPITFHNNGNSVVFLDSYYSNYYNDIKSDYSNSIKYYDADIKRPILDTYFSKCEYTFLVQMSYQYPIMDTLGMVKSIVELNDNRTKISQLIFAALDDCNKYLKNDSITVYIKPATGYEKMMISKMGGITALTTGKKQIILAVDPTVASWQETIKYNIAHEFNHTYWTKMCFATNPSWTLLNYLVFEGRADSYAHFIYPQTNAPWTSSLSDTAETGLWGTIKSQLSNQDQGFQRKVMFGDRDKYPLWGGYTLGYRIVQSALKNNPNLMPSQWAVLPPDSILKMSSYRP